MSPAASVSFDALGTTAGLHVTDPEALRDAQWLLNEELGAIDLACSRFRGDSELSRVNAAGGGELEVSRLLLDAVEAALRAARVSAGTVVPTVGRAMRAIGYDRDFALVGAGPTRSRIAGAVVPAWHTVAVDHEASTLSVPPGVELDLGATAKALAADRAARRIGTSLDTGVLVNLGGDIAVAGDAPDGGWSVLVTDDHRDGTAADGERVTIESGGLATSSTTVRRWDDGGGSVHHIIDPSRGTSADVVWRTVSVAADSCVDANTASTAAIIRGDEAPAWLGGLGLPSRLVRADGTVTRLGGWPQPEV